MMFFTVLRHRSAASPQLPSCATFLGDMLYSLGDMLCMNFLAILWNLPRASGLRREV